MIRRAFEIGDPDGRIALYLNKQGAIYLAATFGPSDKAYDELMEAVSRAYPEPDEMCPCGHPAECIPGSEGCVNEKGEDT